jgi:hypothetical protein
MSVSNNIMMMEAPASAWQLSTYLLFIEKANNQGRNGLMVRGIRKYSGEGKLMNSNITRAQGLLLLNRISNGTHNSITQKQFDHQIPLTKYILHLICRVHNLE